MNAPFKPIVRPFFRMPWTDERLAKLAELFQDGQSFSRIAATLGEGATRNSCIGKVHRMGIKRNPTTTAPQALSPLPRRGRPARRKPPAKPVAARIVILKAKGEPKMSVKLAINEPIIDRSQAFICTDDTSIPIMDLVDGVCHWPYDVQDEPVRYCGVKAIEGASWCETHARRVWQPARHA